MSLRLRLLLALGVVTLAALAAGDVAVYAGLRTSLIDGVDASLTSSSAAVSHFLAPDDDDGEAHGPGPGAPEGNGPSGGGPGGGFCERATALSAGSYVALLGPNRAPISGEVCPGRTPGGATYQVSATAIPVLAASGGSATAPVTYFDSGGAAGPERARASALPDGDELVVAVPLAAAEGTLGHLALIELLSGVAALLGALLLGWWLIRVGMRPLRAVEHTAVAIAEGDLTERVPGGQRRTEVGRVAAALNSMLERIEAAFAARDATEAELRASEQRLRRFVADASHELRTPVAAVAAYAELFSKGASERREDLNRVMSGIRGESARMAALVEDLLLLARLDEGRPLERHPVELVALASEAIRTAQTVGPQWPTHLVADQPVEVEGDALRLRQVLDNLLANVRAHTPVGTETTVSVRAEADEAVLEVADTGPGIPKADVGRLFERFYRVDPSRARVSGGAGLGLAIVESIVLAHGGRVAALANEPHGTVMRLALPLAPPPS